MVLAGGRGPGLRRAGCELVLLQGFLDAPGVRSSDALVDGECVLQVHRGLAGGAVVEVALADATQPEMPVRVSFRPACMNHPG